MKLAKFDAFLVVLSFLWGFSSEAEVYCEFREACLLKDSFKAGPEVVIHWIQMSAGDAPVHSYYHGKDQLTYQDSRFRDRTRLFLAKISEGNSSLLLTETHFEDEGSYKCYTSTTIGSEESFINLKVHAPVHSVTLQQLGNIITCSSYGIYPKPHLSWTPKPPLSPETTISTLPTSQHLYNISSSLTLSHDDKTEEKYSCKVSTETSSVEATFSQMAPLTVSNSEVTIRCSSSNAALTTLMWTFNQSETILTQSSPKVNPAVSEGWSQRVKEVSPSGALTLHRLTPEQDGLYTCHLSTAHETLLSNTFLTIEEGGGNTAAIALGVIIPLILTSAAIGICCWRRYVRALRKKSKKKKEGQENVEEPALLNEETGGP